MQVIYIFKKSLRVSVKKVFFFQEHIIISICLCESDVAKCFETSCKYLSLSHHCVYIY